MTLHPVLREKIRAGVCSTRRPIRGFAGFAWRAARLMASPEMMMAIVRIGACPRPIVSNRLERGGHYGRNHSLLHYHRTHRPPYDIGGRNARHHRHEEREHPKYSSYTALHKSNLLQVNTVEKLGGYEG